MVKMVQLNYDLDENEDVLTAVQIILNAFSTNRKILQAVVCERDALLSRIKAFENNSSSNKMLDISDNESRRKRAKKKSTSFNDSSCVSPHQEINDELNDAFRSSICEDDVIEPTQYEISKIQLKKSTSKSSPGHKSQHSIEQNKENEENKDTELDLQTFDQLEKSPTMLGKCGTRVDSKKTGRQSQKLTDCVYSNEKSPLQKSMDGNLRDQSAKWFSKAPNKHVTPRCLFDNRTSLQQDTPNATSRKKLSIARTLNKTRLKQSTINFPKNEQETFCESISVVDHSIQSGDNHNTTACKLKIKEEKEPCHIMKNQKKHLLHHVNEKNELNDSSVIALTNEINEIINIDDSEPTQALYQHVLDIKQELLEEPSLITQKVQSEPNGHEVSATGHSDIECEMCDQYHRLLGRDMEKNPPRKYGVCSKHHRNAQIHETPPGFWNPKIVDSDSDHEETPYDPRYVNHKK